MTVEQLQAINAGDQLGMTSQRGSGIIVPKAVEKVTATTIHLACGRRFSRRTGYETKSPVSPQPLSKLVALAELVAYEKANV